MLLSKPDILAYVAEGRLRFDPAITEDRIAQVSVDLKLGRKFTTFKKLPGYLPCINVDQSIWDFRLSTPVPERDLYGTSESDTFQGQTDPIPYKKK